MYVTEILSWNAKAGVSDQQMITAMQTMLPDLKNLPGFLFQNLSKDAKDRWVAVYFWQTAEDAHNSNVLIANKKSMTALMQLLHAETIEMEVMEPLQGSGTLLFT
jgi:L-lactate utilization protein LutB